MKKVEAAREALIQTGERLKIRSLDPKEPMAQALRVSSTVLDAVQSSQGLEEAAGRLGVKLERPEDFVPELSRKVSGELEKVSRWISESGRSGKKRYSGFDFHRLQAARSVYEPLLEAVGYLSNVPLSKWKPGSGSWIGNPCLRNELDSLLEKASSGSDQ